MTHAYKLIEATVYMDRRKAKNNEIVSFRKLLCISSRLLPSLG